MISLVSRPIRAVRALSDRLRDADNRLSQMARDLRNARIDAEGLDDAVRAFIHHTPLTYVYVLPPDGFPIHGRAIRVTSGGTALTFVSQQDLPAGCWIVCTGPASVVSVRIGNLAQESFPDFSGHVCQTKTPWNTSVYLTVVLSPG